MITGSYNCVSLDRLLNSAVACTITEFLKLLKLVVLLSDLVAVSIGYCSLFLFWLIIGILLIFVLMRPSFYAGRVPEVIRMQWLPSYGFAETGFSRTVELYYLAFYQFLWFFRVPMPG